jgi:hypothetical protein
MATEDRGRLAEEWNACETWDLVKTDLVDAGWRWRNKGIRVEAKRME